MHFIFEIKHQQKDDKETRRTRIIITGCKHEIEHRVRDEIKDKTKAKRYKSTPKMSMRRGRQFISMALWISAMMRGSSVLTVSPVFSFSQLKRKEEFGRNSHLLIFNTFNFHQYVLLPKNILNVFKKRDLQFTSLLHNTNCNLISLTGTAS